VRKKAISYETIIAYLPLFKGICKNIGIVAYFGSMTVESVGVSTFVGPSLGNRLASFLIVPKNCSF